MEFIICVDIKPLVQFLEHVSSLHWPVKPLYSKALQSIHAAKIYNFKSNMNGHVYVQE